MSDNEQRDLLNKVLSNEIDWREALKIITTLDKSWKSKEWKEKRKEKLASHCEKCNSTTPPLVLQHTWHPKPISELFFKAREDYLPQWMLWKQSHPISVDASSLIPDADGCPTCGSTTIRFRKRAKTWICASKSHGITCGNVFEAPVRVISNEAIKKLEKIAYKKTQEEFDDEYGIGKKVTAIAIEQHLRYTSLKDTKTLCKKCAFVEDKTDMVLCQVCKKNYHSKKYNRCSSCAGIDTTESREAYQLGAFHLS
jgi:hypothetical protein